MSSDTSLKEIFIVFSYIVKHNYKSSRNTLLTLALFLVLEKKYFLGTKRANAFSLITVFDLHCAGSDSDREGGFSDYF